MACIHNPAITCAGCPPREAPRADEDAELASVTHYREWGQAVTLCGLWRPQDSGQPYADYVTCPGCLAELGPDEEERTS